ncbi:phospholipase D-like domain-containing protein [Halomonas sp.]|uniref:phospholipase D-like domain-containing protein n=1 Tax=Halomonas sp. TaxID=1486246 RepID=UPI00298E8121|nr:phospholipase D-like domain-containing protein [Halomonas sp.]MDW7746774.1 phospholipase D-like domain-containing protein [Halomonas sp.]
MTVPQGSIRAGSNSSGVCNAECEDNTIRLFIEGDALFDAMLSDFSSARRRVWLESYIFADDAIGRDFMKTLSDCSQRGLDVRVRVDALGSHFGLPGGSSRRLKEAGVRFIWCHPWQWRKPWLFHRRNHRKLAIVDDNVAYLGGFNITELNSRQVFGDTRWRDTHFRIVGPVVDDARRAFESFGKGDLKWQCGGKHGGIELLTNHGHTCRYRLRCHLKDRFKAARNRLWLTTPYFLPDAGTQRDLCRAASDGVDVRVLVPGKNDVPFVQWASRETYSRLLASGIRIFEYQPRVLHAKTLIVDDDWSTVGSANLDYRSLFINYELTLAVDCQSLNTALATIFEIDLNESIEVQREPWSRRPLSARMAEFIGWSARHWL